MHLSQIEHFSQKAHVKQHVLEIMNEIGDIRDLVRNYDSAAKLRRPVVVSDAIVRSLRRLQEPVTQLHGWREISSCNGVPSLL